MFGENILDHQKMSLMICTTKIIHPPLFDTKVLTQKKIYFSFAGNSEQHQSSEMTELHRLRRELQDEQDRVQRLSAQLSTNVRWCFFSKIFKKCHFSHKRATVGNTVWETLYKYHPPSVKESIRGKYKK